MRRGEGERGKHTTVSHIGTIIPCAPASSARFIIQASPAGMRTIGEEPEAVMAPMERYISLSVMLPCSQSIKTHCVSLSVDVLAEKAGGEVRRMVEIRQNTQVQQ